jgi:UDP-N-acetylmuramoyl-L-alanyl-D-glutamate--2,6-diaminopimelate ligase
MTVMMAARGARQEIRLSGLLHGIVSVPAPLDRAVTGLSTDSRRVRAGELFLARRGTRTSGVNFIGAAARAGAVAALADADELDASLRWTIPVIGVPDLAGNAGVIAARYYGEPSRALRLVGITGTNGKSSVSHFIAAAQGRIDGRRTGIIGTLGYGLPGELAPGNLTTPDPVELQSILAAMRERGFRCVVMEVSSHALDQRRVAGVKFDVAVFTNLSRDHLDYHHDMEAYGRAKERLFLEYAPRTAVINLDDAFGRQLRDRHGGRTRIVGYRIADGAAAAEPGAIVGVITRDDIGDLAVDAHTPWGRAELRAPLTGRFNASNLLAALGALCSMDVPLQRAAAALGAALPVPGRMETFIRRGAPAVVVDYAHTPDALGKALAALRGRRTGRLICVFGCGGDRDPGKRPLMGSIAESGSDLVYVTSDNPRSEPPGRIIDEIVAGMRQPQAAVVEADRAAAVAQAIADAGPDDVVLVAGKGHEDYQEIAGRRFPFSDRALVTGLLGERG